MQTSLELDRLLAIFFDEVRHLIAIQGLAYRHLETDVDLALGEPEGVMLNYALSHQGDSLGELSLFSQTSLNDFTVAQLESAIGCIIFPLRNALLYRRAIQASLKDPLTGAGNRVALEQSLRREIEMSRRHGQALSVIMLDMDHFKSLNDTHGHLAGDAALRATALLLKEQLRNVDMVFRFGGEEFFLVLSNTSPDAAAIVGERIRAAIESLPFLVGEKQVRLTASLGCATYQMHESLENLAQRADEALYDAKRKGRNRMQIADA
jgi:diguanylate cyclase (GGDEF)-like protein